LIEGFSNAVLEKLAAGLSVVAIDVTGNPEALDSMLDGELVWSMTSADLGAMVDVYEHLYLSRVIDEAC
jgi:hypothetical protein